MQAATASQFERVLQTKVIPNYQTFFDNIRVVVTPTKEIQDLNALYISGARLMLTGRPSGVH